MNPNNKYPGEPLVLNFEQFASFKKLYTVNRNCIFSAVTASLGTTKSCVVAGVDDVKLLCTVSSGCCTSTRVWEKIGVAKSLLNNGGSLDATKYVEDYEGGGTIGGPIEFNLIIKNVQKSDFGEKYKCQYSVYSSNELYLNDTLCKCKTKNWIS